MEQVALLDQPLITSLLSHSKNYSLFKTLYTSSANLAWPRRINSPCTNLFLLCGISCCFLYSYCLTELAQLIFFFVLLNKTDFNTLALCGSLQERATCSCLIGLVCHIFTKEFHYCLAMMLP